MSRKLPLYALLCANVISMTGNMMAMLCIPWFVLQTSGSPVRIGITAFFGMLATVPATFIGGTIADRVGHKRISVLADLLSMGSVAAIPLLHATIGLDFWMLLLLVFFGAICDGPGVVGRTALLPQLAERADVRLERASAMMDGVGRAAGLIGAPLAGLLIATLGTSTVLAIDAVSFLLSAALVGLAVPALARAGNAGPGDAQPRPAARTEMLEGLRYVFSHPLVVTLTVTLMITNFFDTALNAVIYPVYIERFFGAALTQGLLIASFGATALLSTIVFGAIGHRYPRRALLAGGLVIVSLRFFAMAWAPSLPLLFGIHILGGLAIGPVNPIMMTLGFERIPRPLQARVFAAIGACSLIASPLAMLTTGYLLEWLGTAPVLWTMGVCYFITGAALWFNPAMREIEPGAVEAVPAAV